jgi:uncharacterized small protein (DUF1192 family)
MSDNITRAIDWVGCTTNSPAHAHEIRMDALKALADLRAELAAANSEIARLSADNEKQRERVKKWVNEAMRHEDYDDDQ